ncbi:MAG: HD-GYP domain-containing protein [Tepidiformaceae bacterium]
MIPTERQRRMEELLIVSVFALGAAAFTLSFFMRSTDDMFGLFTVVLLSGVAERLSVRLYFEGRVSVGFVGTILCVLLFGPLGGALAVAAAMLSQFIAGQRSPQKVLFNFGHHSLAAVIVGIVLRFTGVSGNLGNPPVALAGGALGGLVLFFVSAMAVSAIISTSSGRSFRASYRESFAWLLPHYIVLGLVAGGIAILFEEVGIAAVLVLCLPILLSGYSMEQFVNRTRDNVVRLEASNTQLQRAVVEVGEMSEQLREAYTGTLESLVTALDVRDQETRGHSVRVATHSLDIAKMLGIHDDEELAYVYRGALMHDVGKIGVPDAILLKPAKLTEEEWEFMRRHPAMGYRILAQVPYLRPAAKIVLAHHERWDGDGYPRRLKGPEIPLGARIFALCDTYDAIISDRPYRMGQTPDAAMAEILRCAGTQFDPRVIEAFEAAFPRWREESHDEAARPLYLPAWKDPGGEERAAS